MRHSRTDSPSGNWPVITGEWGLSVADSAEWDSELLIGLMLLGGIGSGGLPSSLATRRSMAGFTGSGRSTGSPEGTIGSGNIIISLSSRQYSEGFWIIDAWPTLARHPYVSKRVIEEHCNATVENPDSIILRIWSRSPPPQPEEASKEKNYCLIFFCCPADCRPYPYR